MSECPHCAELNEPGATHCSNCGWRIGLTKADEIRIRARNLSEETGVPASVFERQLYNDRRATG